MKQKRIKWRILLMINYAQIYLTLSFMNLIVNLIMNLEMNGIMNLIMDLIMVIKLLKTMTVF